MSHIIAAFGDLSDLFDIAVPVMVTVTVFYVGRRWLKRV